MIWSKLSVLSQYVQDEAHEGLVRGRLIPVLIDEVKPPLGFRQLQAVSLVEWLDREADEELAVLMGSIQAMVPAAGEVGGGRAQGHARDIRAPNTESPPTAAATDINPRERPQVAWVSRPKTVEPTDPQHEREQPVSEFPSAPKPETFPGPVLRAGRRDFSDDRDPAAARGRVVLVSFVRARIAANWDAGQAKLLHYPSHAWRCLLPMLLARLHHRQRSELRAPLQRRQARRADRRVRVNRMPVRNQ